MMRVCLALLVLAALGGCSNIDEDVRETAVNVLTLQSGTISELKNAVNNVSHLLQHAYFGPYPCACSQS